MYHLLGKLALLLQDFTTRTKVKNTFRFLMESQYWSKDQLKEYQLKKLKRIIEIAYRDVPYYNELFNVLTLKPEKIQSLEDLEKIPVLTKEDIRNNQQKFLSSRAIKYSILKGKTGGTTGTPLVVYKDQNTRSFTWGSYYRWYAWMGLKIGDPVITFWGTPSVLKTKPIVKLKKSMVGYLTNNLHINSFRMNEKSMDDIIRKINNFKPRHIHGYTSALYDLFNYNLINNGSMKMPISISTTTETLTTTMREFYKSNFGLDIFDQYGCGEIGGIAYECALHEGLHITGEHVIVETSPDNDLIITDLDNEVMPFIRYKNGDKGILVTDKCKCGCEHPRIASLFGRTADYITLRDGSHVHGVFFTSMLYDIDQQVSKDIRKFQIVQNKSGEIDFYIENSNKLSADFLSKLDSALSGYFFHHEIKITPYIKPGKNGKFRYIINNLNKWK